MTTFPAPRFLGRTARTDLLVATDGITKWFITECCGASAKGTEDGIVCRSCYYEVDPSLGGVYDESFDGPINPPTAEDLELIGTFE